MVLIASNCCAADDGSLGGWAPNASQTNHRSLSIATEHSEFAYPSSNGSSLRTGPHSGGNAFLAKIQPLMAVLSPRR